MADEKKRDDIAIQLDSRGPDSSSAAVDALPKPVAEMASNGVSNNPVIAVLSYCGSSILMTTTNKYVLGGAFNLSFFLLCVQVCGRP